MCQEINAIPAIPSGVVNEAPSSRKNVSEPKHNGIHVAIDDIAAHTGAEPELSVGGRYAS
jgi:hypothetical protein